MDAFDLAERLQTPIFVLSDLDLGMNNWMSTPVRLPDQAARPREAPRRRDAEAPRRVGPLPRRRRRRHPLSDGAGRRHAGLFHPRLRPQRQGAVQRARRRLRQQPRSACTQVRDGPDARAEAGGRNGRQGRHRPDRLRDDALGHHRVARSVEERGASSTPRTCACARFRSRRRSRSSSTGATGSTWSSRIATRR